MEKVVDVVYRDDNIIIHIGREGFTSTRFFILSPQTAKEVRDILNDFLTDSDKH